VFLRQLGGGGFLSRPRRLQGRPGLGYLDHDLLVLGAADLLVDAKFLVAGQVSGLLLREHLGRLVVLPGEPLDTGEPSLQVLIEVGRALAGADKFLSLPLELGDGILYEIDFLRISLHVAVGSGPVQPPGPRVQFGDLPVEHGPCFL